MAKPSSSIQELLRGNLFRSTKNTNTGVLYYNSFLSPTHSEFFNVHNDDSNITAQETAKGRKMNMSLLKVGKVLSLNTGTSDRKMIQTHVPEFSVPRLHKIAPAIDTGSMDWIKDFECTESFKSPEMLSYTYYKIIAKISLEDDVMDYYGLLSNGIMGYVYDLQNSSAADFFQASNRILRAKDFLSKTRNTLIFCCIFPQICNGRLQTGELKRSQAYVHITAGQFITLTCDRKYAKQGTHKLIYISCLDILKKLQFCDSIQIDKICLNVLEIKDKSITCKVIVGGQLKPRTEVNFGHHKISEDELSAEVLEDISFIRNKSMNYFILPKPVSQTYYENIAKAFEPKNIKSMKVICHVDQSHLKDNKIRCWLLKNCAGVIIKLENEITDEAKTFIDLLYEHKKAIIFTCPTKQCIESDIVHTLYYADSFYMDYHESLKINQIVARTNMKNFENYAYKSLFKSFTDSSSTSSDCMARAIVQMSFEVNAKAILVSSTSGRMAMKLSHFRPKCPIILISNNPDASTGLQIFHNIHVAYYIEDPNMPQIIQATREDYLLRRLAAGLYFGLVMEYLNNLDTVIFCFKFLPGNAYANKIIVFELNAITAQQIHRYYH